jgi:hypothetical protein
MNQTEKCVEIYRRNQDIGEVASETGLPWHIAYIHLKRAKVLNIETRLVSGAPNDQMGAWYEREFRRLVPSARSQNDVKAQNKVDYLVGAAKVEIKSSSLYTHGGGMQHWKFRVFSPRTRLRNADYYVCFGRLDTKDLNNYAVFLFPAEVLTVGNVTVRLDGQNLWSQFKIETGELQPFFDTLESFE